MSEKSGNTSIETSSPVTSSTPAESLIVNAGLDKSLDNEIGMNFPRKKASSTFKSSSKQIRDITEKKNKLRTSKDVYDRLKWAGGSTNVDIDSLYIGYLDRFLGMCEISFNEYNPAESDIPYHRIYYFRSGGPAISPIVGEQGEICVRESNWPEGSVIHWDRESRIDLVFNSGETSSGKVKGSKRPTGVPNLTGNQEICNSDVVLNTPENYVKVPCYKYSNNEQRWETYTTDKIFSFKPNLKIVTFNILFELYDPEIVQCSVRWPYLIDLLENTNADVIALQEVTPSFLKLLQAQPWCQNQYYLTDIAEKSLTIKRYGQIILSKIPPASVFWSEIYSKRFVFATFLLNNNVLHIAVVHLKSDHDLLNHAEMRCRQMRVLRNAILSTSSSDTIQANIITVGDTNFRNDEKWYPKSSIDVWPFLMGQDNPGYTFDVTKNPLAKKNSTRHQICRFDRIFMEPDTGFLKPLRINLIGKELIDRKNLPMCLTEKKVQQVQDENPLSMSDHYGLECEFELLPPDVYKTVIKSTIQPVYTSAVVIIPPEELWPSIQKIRSEFDPGFARWMPHINLLYGFIPDIDLNFRDAHDILTATLKSFPPFECKLSNFGSFRHGKSATIYLSPDEDKGCNEVKQLQSLLAVAYPLCSEQSNKSSAGFTPHLTVAKFTDGKENYVEIKVNEWKLNEFGEHWNKEFTIDRIYLISRTDTGPFKIQNTVYFGSAGGKNLSTLDQPLTGTRAPNSLEDFLLAHNLLPTPAQEDLRAFAFNELKTLCSTVLNEATEGKIGLDWKSLYLIGSGAMGFHNDKSDIDALCCGSGQISHEKFFEYLQKVISTNPHVKLHHLVLDTLVPLAKLSIRDIEIDLIYSSCPNPWDLKDKDFNQLTDINVRSVAGVRDAMKLNSIIPGNWRSSYQTAVRGIKFWAKARNIYSKGFGYFGGFPLSLMMAYVVVTIHIAKPDSNPTPEELVLEFFYQFANWKWPAPVQFHTKIRKHQHSKIPELMPVLAPAFPYNNSARNVTKSTRSLSRREFQRGHEILSRKSNSFLQNWKSLVEKAPFFDIYSNYLDLQITSSCLETSQICNGFLESKLVSLIVYLEKEHLAFVQPFTKVYNLTSFGNGNANSAILTAFLGLDFKKLSPKANLSNAIEYFQQKFDKWKFKPADSILQIQLLSTSEENDCDMLKGFRE